MIFKLVCADFLQKALAFTIFSVFARIKSGGNLKWIIIGVSLSTLPNTLVLGIPLLRTMYGMELWFSWLILLCYKAWFGITFCLILFELNATNESSSAASPTIVTGELEDPPKDEGEVDERIRNPKERNIKMIFLTVGKKLIRNPNTHASLAGLTWASIHFRLGVKLPNVIEKSVSILSDGGLGMAMFCLGLFMASQKSVIACGTRKATLTMAMKFVAGPLLMAAPLNRTRDERTIA